LASKCSDSRITSFSIHNVGFFGQMYLWLLKMFWGAGFQTRLVLGYVLAADCTGVFALLPCKSVLVFLAVLTCIPILRSPVRFKKKYIYINLHF
jgi:hypothetical protein